MWTRARRSRQRGNTTEDWKTLNDPNADKGKQAHIGTRGVGNAVVTAMAGVAFIKELPEMAEKMAEKIKKVKNEVELIGKYDWNLVRKYFKYIQDVTGREIPQKQIDKLKEALRKKEYIKLSEEEIVLHRKEFNSVKNKLIENWEKETGQKWPTYTEPYYTKDGKEYKKIGDPYDAHHIIENQYGGDNEWWNIHPAKFPDEHQGGIHGVNSPYRDLFK